MADVTSDPIAQIIGDYRAFAAMQRDRLLARGIDIAPYPLSHLAVRVADWDLYVHQRVYRMGLEHLGVVVGDEFDEFSHERRAVLTGQQFQSADIDPVYVLFEDFTHVKFYRRSFFDVVEDAVGGFEGFRHVADWVPQRLVTATGANSLPR
jgi:hypothetical protein